MKKIIIPAAVIIALCIGAMVFSALRPAPKVILFENELKRTEATFNKDNVKFLNDVGFEKSHNVENNLPAVYSELVKYYKDKFGLEFFAERVVNKTLSETGLILGSTHQFIGTIPDKNIEEIKTSLGKINAPLFTSELKYNFYGDYIITDGETNLVIDVVNDDDPRITDKDILDYCKRDGAKNYWLANMAMEHCYPTVARITYAPKTKWAKPMGMPEKYDLMIIASAKEFNLTSDQMIQNNKITDKPKVKDPMVLLKVDGGYVKLTSWN